MAKVINGDKGGNQLNASADKAQVYGLKGDDTIISNYHKDVLLIGGSGNDSLIMTGGNGTLSGGKGSDVFELNYSASSTLSAVIEDFEPSNDKIIVNFDGNLPAMPQLNHSTLRSGDVVLKDSDGLLNVTLKSVRENDYFDGSSNAADDERFFEVLELTNAERENPTMPEAPDVSADSKEYKKYTAEYEEQQKLVAEAKTKNLPLLTLSEGLAVGAAIRADETAMLGGSGVLDNHIRPNNQGGYSTVIVDKELNLSLSGKYSAYGENLQAGAELPEEVVSDWIGSLSHHENILDERFQKLGVGYSYSDTGGMKESRYYWTQLFANGLNSPETVSTRELLSVSPEIHMTSKSVVGNDEANTIKNDIYGATIDALGGDDSINNSALVVSISGGSGKDTVDNSGSFVTINAGTGDDSIKLSSKAQNNLIEYRAGDGSDTVSGFKSTDTLSIVGDEYNPVTVGKDVVVSVGNDSITLKDAASLETVNIEGTRSKLFIGTDGDNKIPNTLDGATIDAQGGNDSIVSEGANVSISGGAGKDTVENSGSSVTINAGTGDDKITLDTDAKNNLIQYAAGDGNDSVEGFDANDTLSIVNDEYTPIKIREDLVVAVGNDSITLLDAASLSNPNIDGTRSKLFIGTTGGDTFNNTVDDATIQALDGNDTIINGGKNVSIDAGTGNNSINNSDGTAIIAFNGQTTIENFHFGFGEGSDTVYIPKEAPSVDFKTDGLSLYTDNASLIFKNAKTTSKVNMYYESQSRLNKEVFIADDDWYVTNDNELNGEPLYFVGATAKMNHGVDFSNVTKDLDVTLNTEYVSNNANLWVNNVHSVKGGASYTTIHGSDKNDSIIAGTGLTTIDGGKGNDYISLPGDAKENLIEYRAGDGSDTVIGFDANDTLRIGDGTGTYSTQKSGNDFVVTVSDGKITLAGGAGLSSVNIVGSLVTTGGGSDTTTPITPTTPANPKFITLAEDNASYYNTVDGATIQVLGVNDHIYNGYNSEHETINGGNSVSIKGGAGGDYIDNASSRVTINVVAGDDTIHNEGSNVTIDLGAGNDNIYNEGDSATIASGAGADSIGNHGDSVTIDAGAGDDSVTNWGDSVTINGGADNDSIENYSSSVTIDGGAGDDSIHNQGFFGGGHNVAIDGGDGDDTLNNSGEATSINGGEGNDEIYNSGSNVTIDGGAGNDSIPLWSGAENNLIEYKEGEGNDTIEGFNEDDTLKVFGTYPSIETVGSDVVLDVGDGKGSVVLKDAATLTTVNIENDTNYIALTEIADDYTVESSNVTIAALGGNDVIYNNDDNVSIGGGEGDDTINTWGDNTNVSVNSGTGDDFIHNNAFNSTLDAGDGNDSIGNWGENAHNVSISSGAGNDTIDNNGNNCTIDGGTDNDNITNSGYYGGGHNVSINGGDDDDTINNYCDTVTIDGGDGADYVNNGGSNATISGGDGNDSIENNKSYVSVNAGAGNDTIINFDGSNVTITGDAGNDTIISSGDSVTIDSGAGDDFINNASFGSLGSFAYLRGTGGDDTVWNSGSNVTIDGGDGNDSIQNWSGNSVKIDGGDGNDSIDNRGDSVTIDGGDDSDRVLNFGSNVTISGGDGEDYVNNGGSNVTISGNEGNDSIENNKSYVSINAGVGNDTIINFDGSNVTITGDAGKDTIISSGDSVTIDGGADNDYVWNYGSSVTIVGGDDDDDISNEAGSNVTIDGGKGNDTIGNRYYITTAEDGSSIEHYGHNVSISGGDGDDFILTGDFSVTGVTADGGSGNDEIYNRSAGVSINGGDGNDTISNDDGGGVNSTLIGGAGDDSINNSGSNVTIIGGTGNDRISLTSDTANNLIQYKSGDDSDTVSGFDENDTLQISSGTGTYSAETVGNDVIVNVGSGSVLLEGAASLSVINISGTDTSTAPAGKLITLTEEDDVYPSNIFPSIADNVTIAALGGNDSITNRNKSNVSISGAAGSDTIDNQGDKATLDGGDDNDLINNGTSSLINNKSSLTVSSKRGGSNVSINGGAGDDRISNTGSNATILGGTGNDQITLASTSQNNVIRYTAGDGNDTIWGIQDNDTLNLFPENVQYSKERVVNTNDMIIKIGGGSILIKNAANKRTKITLGESGTSGGTVGDGGDNDNSLSGNNGGNDGKDNSQKGPSTNEGKNNAATQGRSATGSSGRGTSTSTSESGGNGSRRNPTATHSVSTSTQQTSSNTFGNVLNSLQQNQQNPSATATVNQHVYAGGNQIISNYQSGEKIIFGADYTGSFFDNAGNFIVGSSTGALVVQNAIGKIIDISDGVGNPFLNAYAATNAGVIDWRGLSGFEVINGSAGADVVYASDGGSQLYGGVDTLTDVLVGGAGVDIFVVGKTQGADIILNASSGDVVFLNDSTLNDIVATGEIDGTINLAFNNGNVISVQGFDANSATFMLADGSAYQYNNITKTWQVTQYVYAGGNQVISDYQAGDKIIFRADYAGAAFDDAGNFIAGSSTGALIVQNATDKFIDLKDYAGNPFVKAYAATAAGIIDGRGQTGFELINGSAGEDIIYSGDGGSQLWGGADAMADTLVGGNGADIFIGGKTQGGDFFLNASSADLLHLNDATLSDIIATEENNGAIAIAFNNGNAVAVQSTEPISAAVMFADGSAYRYNHTNKSWQSA